MARARRSAWAAALAVLGLLVPGLLAVQEPPGTSDTRASRLQDARVISYSRGNIRLRDRPGLEARSCGCYQAVRDEQARMMKSLREL